MKTRTDSSRKAAGFTVVEILITMTIIMLVTAGAMSVFLTGARAMYKDMQRLATDATLRRLTLQVAKETIDSSEFYVFSSYTKLDGTVSLTADVSPLETDLYGTEVAYGDCLVLVTRVTVDETSNVRQFRIYYRVPRTPASDYLETLRYYEGTDYGASGTASSLTTLLNAVNLNTTPAFTGSRILAEKTRGRPRTPPNPAVNPMPPPYYSVFSTESSTPTATTEAVSMNIEVINGTTAANMLSSSSFNYTIAPRR